MAVDTYTKVLLHFDGEDGSHSFTDESGKTWSTYGSGSIPELDTDYKKFGSASGRFFGGTNGIIYTPWHTDFENIGPFTIDFWIRFNSLSGTQKIFNVVQSSTSFFQFYWESNTFKVWIYDHSVQFSTSTLSLSTGQWYHVALTRLSGTWRIFVDGEMKADYTGYSGTLANWNSNVCIGGQYYSGPTECVDGWIDEFRFSRLCRWVVGGFPLPDRDYSKIFYPYAYANRDGDFFTDCTYFNNSNEYFDIGDSYNCFIVFDNVAIPKNATLTEAYIELCAWSYSADDTVKVKIHFADEDDPSIPTSCSDINSRSRTTGVEWNNVPHTEENGWITTPDIKTALQPVVNRSGWSSGNKVMAIILDNGGDPGAYRDIWEAYSLRFPELRVDWTEGGPSPQQGSLFTFQW